MQITEVKIALEGLVFIAQSKGLCAPYFDIEIQPNAQLRGHSRWSETEQSPLKYEYYYDEDVKDILARMRQELSLVLSKEDRERNEYLRRLAETIEYGKKIGIDEDFINPLALQMRKLSEGAITYIPLVLRNVDDIPF